MERLRDVDWLSLRRDCHHVFAKLIRTKDPRETDSNQEIPVPPKGRQRLSRCLTTVDLTSLGVGSCVGTGMYLVAGMVARKYAGPGVVISFMIAALASIFSGACYAEFGVRVPNTTGSAYTYSYVTVGEFIAFIIGWNMVLEYLIGTSACARALSASFDTIMNGDISNALANCFGTIYGKPPDLLAFFITIAMMMVLVTGVKKSLFFNNILNIINLSVWVFIMAAGLFYIDVKNWTEHGGFLPFGWNGVFTGAATCFYAFIGFDIIATTGEEAQNPKRSIPLAIVSSLAIILVAYVSSSFMLTLIVPYDEVETDSALVQMFGHIHAPTCKYIVALGALAGLTVSMFGSMFPMPRILYAMALDGLIFKVLATISESTGTPTLATVCGGLAAAFVSLFVQLEVLVEMMSIGTLLAYTLVSTCVLILRYQPQSTNLIELLPQSIRTPEPQPGISGQTETAFTSTATRVMIRRVTRSSPDSDDSMMGEDEDDGRDDTFLVNSTNTENKFYGAVPGGSCNPSRFGRFLEKVVRQLQVLSYLFPGLFPWVDVGPPSEQSGIYVIKAVGVMYAVIIVFDLIAAYGSPGSSTFTIVIMVLLFLTILTILTLISRRPQNRSNLMYATPCLPFVPAVAIIVNIYLILNLSILTLVRFTVWMALGMVMYFKYGIKNSTLETNPPGACEPAPPTPNPLDLTTIPPPSSIGSTRTTGDRNIFEGDGSSGLYGNGNQSYGNAATGNTIVQYGTHNDSSASQLTWHVTEPQPSQSSGRHAPGANSSYKQVETRYNARTNSISSHASSRPPWAYPDATYDTWDD